MFFNEYIQLLLCALMKSLGGAKKYILWFEGRRGRSAPTCSRALLSPKSSSALLFRLRQLTLQKMKNVISGNLAHFSWLPRWALGCFSSRKEMFFWRRVAEWAIGLANHRKEEEEIPWKNLNLNWSVTFYFLHRLKKTRVYSKKVSFIYKRFSRKLGSDCISRKV